MTSPATMAPEIVEQRPMPGTVEFENQQEVITEAKKTVEDQINLISERFNGFYQPEPVRQAKARLTEALTHLEGSEKWLVGYATERLDA